MTGIGQKSRKANVREQVSDVEKLIATKRNDSSEEFMGKFRLR
jgi:hypothetical protein